MSHILTTRRLGQDCLCALKGGLTLWQRYIIVWFSIKGISDLADLAVESCLQQLIGVRMS